MPTRPGAEVTFARRKDEERAEASTNFKTLFMFTPLMQRQLRHPDVTQDDPDMNQCPNIPRSRSPATGSALPPSRRSSCPPPNFGAKGRVGGRRCRPQGCINIETIGTHFTPSSAIEDCLREFIQTIRPSLEILSFDRSICAMFAEAASDATAQAARSSSHSRSV
ncbi:hypothetical protein B0H16DRAFT_1589972 [Mycena metata]|uniref:Uncharacterized protein n=1 Tax=Mycena metata TaxID=1033252 RepID=A0AAD7MQB6_9AGAR|nr:hypothetical protein B0H16DRAFT_1589972 [Mycena metata]